MVSWEWRRQGVDQYAVLLRDDIMHHDVHSHVLLADWVSVYNQRLARCINEDCHCVGRDHYFGSNPCSPYGCVPSGEGIRAIHGTSKERHHHTSERAMLAAKLLLFRYRYEMVTTERIAHTRRPPIGLAVREEHCHRY